MNYLFNLKLSIMKRLLFARLLSKSTTKFVTFSLLTISSFANVNAQNISTIAGNGTMGSTGDGGAATAATLSAPWGVASDAAGNIYVADEAANCIRKINSTGIISTIAGTGVAGFSGDGGPATAAQLNNPYDVGVDAAGNIYIADYGNNRVRKINTAGIICTCAGTGSTTYSGECGPATIASFAGPASIKVDGAGNIYININANRVSKINTSGIMNAFAGNGITGYTGDGGPATAAKLYNPVGIALDASGNAYIIDQLNHYIRKVNTAGIISTIAGTGSAGYSGDGGPATAAQVNWVWGITTDAIGNIYLGDHYNYRIRKINTSGIISTYVGTGTIGYSGDGIAATTADINAPWGICTDVIGNLYIADGGNYRVRKVLSTINNNPYFLDGSIKSISVCENSGVNSINSLLGILDIDTAQTESWTSIAGPYHGTVSLAGTLLSTGASITPTGFTYSPGTGYHGFDTFKVIVSDGGLTDTAIVYVTIDSVPTVAAIGGSGSVCKGNTVTLSNPTASGIWTSSATVAAVSSLGVVTGVDTGIAIISYTVTNGTCNASTALPVKVTICPSAVTNLLHPTNELNVWPNPNPGTFTISGVFPDHQQQITISNIVGVKIKKFVLTDNKQQEVKLDVPPGMYLLSVISESHERTMIKMMVR